MTAKNSELPETVMAGTDFSRASRQACSWAAGYSVKTGRTLRLLHVYRPPVAVSEGGVIVPPADELEKLALTRIRRLKNSLQRRFGRRLKITAEVRCGIPARELEREAASGGLSLMVMGLTGATRFRERFVGSTATTLIRKSAVPVVTINDRLMFESPKKIVFATDYRMPLQEQSLLKIRAFISELKAEVIFLHVFPPGSNHVFQYEAEAALLLERKFQGIRHRFEAVHGQDVNQAVQHYCKSIDAALLVMVAHEHSFVDRLLHEPYTTRAAFHGKIPLLTIADT